MDVAVKKKKFKSSLPCPLEEGVDPRKFNDHEHCAFCWTTISEYSGDLHEGYCTLDEYTWICPECYEDFKEDFHWTLAEATEE